LHETESDIEREREREQRWERMRVRDETEKLGERHREIEGDWGMEIDSLVDQRRWNQDPNSNESDRGETERESRRRSDRSGILRWTILHESISGRYSDGGAESSPAEPETRRDLKPRTRDPRPLNP